MKNRSRQKYIDIKMVRLVNQIKKDYKLPSFREASKKAAELIGGRRK